MLARPVYSVLMDNKWLQPLSLADIVGLNSTKPSHAVGGQEYACLSDVSSQMIFISIRLECR